MKAFFPASDIETTWDSLVLAELVLELAPSESGTGAGAGPQASLPFWFWSLLLGQVSILSSLPLPPLPLIFTLLSCCCCSPADVALLWIISETLKTSTEVVVAAIELLPTQFVISFLVNWSSAKFCLVKDPEELAPLMVMEWRAGSAFTNLCRPVQPRMLQNKLELLLHVTDTRNCAW